jgi:hypothetical protein
MDPVPLIRASLSPVAMERSGVADKLTSRNIAKQIKAGCGKTILTSVERGKLTATIRDGKLVLTDEEGGTSTVTIAKPAPAFVVR